MAQPPLPALPAIAQATPAGVAQVKGVVAQRSSSGLLNQHQLGLDGVYEFDYTAAVSQAQNVAAGVVPPNANIQALLTQLVVGLAQHGATLAQVAADVAEVKARTNNERVRRRNSRAYEVLGDGHHLPLIPLEKERAPPAAPAAGAAAGPAAAPAAGAAAGAAAVGTLPPGNMFPATFHDIDTYSNAQFNALSAFYGEAFGVPGVLAPRRDAFKSFIKD